MIDSIIWIIVAAVLSIIAGVFYIPVFRYKVEQEARERAKREVKDLAQDLHSVNIEGINEDRDLTRVDKSDEYDLYNIRITGVRDRSAVLIFDGEQYEEFKEMVQEGE